MENRLDYFFSVRCCSLLLLFLALSSKADVEIDDEPPIYFGDSSVNVGEPFKINCRISISTLTEWLKDGESIRKHNLRHGRDDHAYVVTENEIEGEHDKTLSTLSVKHALSVHKGKYQCNKDHTNYFELNVNEPEKTTTISQYGYRNTPKPYKTNLGNISNIDDNVSFGQDQDRSWESSNPSPAVTIETFSKRRKSKVGIEEIPSKPNKQQTEAESKKVTTNFFELVDESDEEEDEDTFRALITTSTPKIRHSKNYHKLNIEMSTIPSNSIASITQATKKPPKKAAQVTGYYDHAERQLRSFEIRFPMVLSCNVSAPGFPELKWRKNGTDVSQIDSLRGRYRIIAAERKFVIDKTEETDAGDYECWVDSLNAGAKFNVYANVAVRVPSNSGVVEGEKLTVHCLVVGTEPVITWSLGNKTFNETTGRYILQEDENKIKNAVFIIENIVLDDRGEYKCTATNPATEYGSADPAQDTTMVRVKGKLAALWPFLGICAEVFILCAIILIYEKRRNKTELEESDTDPNTEQEKLKPQTN